MKWPYAHTRKKRTKKWSEEGITTVTNAICIIYLLLLCEIIKSPEGIIIIKSFEFVLRIFWARIGTTFLPGEVYVFLKFLERTIID